MKFLGFIKEIDGYVFAKPLETFIKSQKNKNAASLITHLQNGELCVDLTGIAQDKDDERMGTLSVFTDGEWYWPDYLSYYLKKYPTLQLEEEFVKYVLETKEKKVLEPTELLNLEKEFLREADFK